MASMKNMEGHLEEEQPTEKKPRIDNCQEEGGNSSYPDESELPKSLEGDKESTNLPSSRCHRKLPAELNCQIFYCLNLATRRKFIWGLGWGFYSMFRQILHKKSKRFGNSVGNGWSRSNPEITISNCGLNASRNPNGFLFQNVYAEKGFPISGQNSREDNFPGTILYYYEIKISKSELWCLAGLTDGEILYAEFVGLSPNSYAIVTPIPNRNFYQFLLVGQRQRFELPDGVIRQDAGNVAGCGILMNPDDKLTIFFTLNGILMYRQFPIDPTVEHLVPTVTFWNDMSLEANFGDNPAIPFEYDIKHCPGMGLDWI